MTMNRISSLIAGLLFGIGLTLSGMTNPAKITNFLDLFGNFDPSLIFVMGGGLVVTAIGYHLTFKRNKPFFAESFVVPGANHIDKNLIGGSALFGIGWGLSGFCPGPAVASLSLGHVEAWAFVAAMLIGITAAKFVTR